METGAEKASAKDGITFFEVLYSASHWKGSLPCSILNMARSRFNNRAMSITSCVTVFSLSASCDPSRDAAHNSAQKRQFIPT